MSPRVTHARIISEGNAFIITLDGEGTLERLNAIGDCINALYPAGAPVALKGVGPEWGDAGILPPLDVVVTDSDIVLNCTLDKDAGEDWLAVHQWLAMFFHPGLCSVTLPPVTTGQGRDESFLTQAFAIQSIHRLHPKLRKVELRHGEQSASLKCSPEAYPRLWDLATAHSAGGSGHIGGSISLRRPTLSEEGFSELLDSYGFIVTVR